MRRRLAAGNWKMNGSVATSLAEVEALMVAHPSPLVDVLVCPPATLLAALDRKKARHPLALGGQDCSPEAAGAFTETLSEREAGRTLDVVGGQLDGSVPEGVAGADLVVAYEPVWAIGTGLTPTTAQIAEVHGALRARLSARMGAEGASVRLLYGGSVKGSNAAGIFAVADVDGALVGGASLRASDFSPIIAALEQAAARDVDP